MPALRAGRAGGADRGGTPLLPPGAEHGFGLRFPPPSSRRSRLLHLTRETIVPVIPPTSAPSAPSVVD